MRWCVSSACLSMILASIDYLMMMLPWSVTSLCSMKITSCQECFLTRFCTVRSLHWTIWHTFNSIWSGLSPRSPRAKMIGHPSRWRACDWMRMGPWTIRWTSAGSGRPTHSLSSSWTSTIWTVNWSVFKSPCLMMISLCWVGAMTRMESWSDSSRTLTSSIWRKSSL